MKYTKQQIEEWKAKHGELFEITVEVMLNQLWVAGDEEIKTRDDLFLAASQKMQEVLEVKEAEIKKL